MEKQKIFWVILSVSVFIVVVLVVGVFLLQQKPPALAAEPAGAIHPLADAGTSIYEYGADQQGTDVLNLVIGGDADSGSTGIGAGVEARAEEPPAAEAEPPAAAAPAPKPQPAAPAARPSVAAAEPLAKPAARPAAKPAPQSVAGPQYWIQTGSYQSQTSAEELARALSEKGLAGRVFSYSSDSGLFFRVRVGPYANRQEAEKFLAIVKRIQGLEKSYISLVPRSKGVN